MYNDEKLFRTLVSSLRLVERIHVEIFLPGYCVVSSEGQYDTEAPAEIKELFRKKLVQDLKHKTKKMKVGESFTYTYQFTKNGPNPDLMNIFEQLPGGPYILGTAIVAQFKVNKKSNDKIIVKSMVVVWEIN